jgi:sulfur relay (sulfurtransferase) DsrC/TusE family protein
MSAVVYARGVLQHSSRNEVAQARSGDENDVRLRGRREWQQQCAHEVKGRDANRDEGVFLPAVAIWSERAASYRGQKHRGQVMSSKHTLLSFLVRRYVRNHLRTVCLPPKDIFSVIFSSPSPSSSAR